MKKKRNWFLNIILVLFVIYLGIFISSKSGYENGVVGKKVALTDEKLKEFETDVLNGENVDIKNYLEKDNKDYSNKFTRAGEKITKSLMTIITKGISGIWDALKFLFFP